MPNEYTITLTSQEFHQLKYLLASNQGSKWESILNKMREQQEKIEEINRQEKHKEVEERLNAQKVYSPEYVQKHTINGVFKI